MPEPTFASQDVLDLWFPNNGFWESQETYSAWIQERMHGGMDAIICIENAYPTQAAARCELDQWAETAEGRAHF